MPKAKPNKKFQKKDSVIINMRFERKLLSTIAAIAKKKHTTINKLTGHYFYKLIYLTKLEEAQGKELSEKVIAYADKHKIDPKHVLEMCINQFFKNDKQTTL